MPPHVAKADAPVQVAFPVALNLRLPELRAGLGQHMIFTPLMSVPEASVHEDAGAIFLQNDVGRAGKPLHMDAETVSVCEKEFPHNHLWFRILAPDAGHALVSLFGREFVCHATNVVEIP